MENEMVVKTWHLGISRLTEEDIIWLKGAKIKLDVETLYNTIHSSTGVSKQFVTGHTIKAETTCERQETMLQLKYGERAYLISQTLTNAEIEEINF